MIKGKKLLSASIAGIMLFLSGCGSTDSEVENRMTAQQLIDKGHYSEAISMLEAKGVKTDGDYMMLSSAYMGKAGFGFAEFAHFFVIDYNFGFT
jgi:hypothetical protein